MPPLTKVKWTRCPLCGSRSIGLVTGRPYRLRLGRAWVSAPTRGYHHCGGCGEDFLDAATVAALRKANSAGSRARLRIAR